MIAWYIPLRIIGQSHERRGRQGFARQVTDSNLAKLAPLLRDRTKKPTSPLSEKNAPSKPTPGPGSDELAAAQSLFAGSRVACQITLHLSMGDTRIGHRNRDPHG